MAKVTFKRYETNAEAETSNVVDGQYIVTKEGTSYIDYGTQRIPVGGLTIATVIDTVYPVGSYYETTDSTFNPNTAWGGTWVLDTAGKVTVAKDENDTDFDTIGKTGGSKELQQHSHKLKYYVNDSLSGGTDHFLVYGSNTATVLNALGTDDAGTGNSGNLQPYIVVNRWHRTA